MLAVNQLSWNLHVLDFDGKIIIIIYRSYVTEPTMFDGVSLRPVLGAEGSKLYKKAELLQR